MCQQLCPSGIIQDSGSEVKPAPASLCGSGLGLEALVI